MSKVYTEQNFYLVISANCSFFAKGLKDIALKFCINNS